MSGLPSVYFTATKNDLCHFKHETARRLGLSQQRQFLVLSYFSLTQRWC